MDELRDLKDEAARAMGRGQWRNALVAYSELSSRDPREGTWPLRAGDAARKLGSHREAIRWYERAAATYGERGFVVRAIAVGKMIESLDPGNDNILRALDAAQAKAASPGPCPKMPPPVPSDAVVAAATAARAVKVSQEPTAILVPPKPPLIGHLSGPPLSPKAAPVVPASLEASMRSMEIVFDDLDDGIPIQASDILVVDDVLEAVDAGRGHDEDALMSRLPKFPLFQVLPQGAFLEVVQQMESAVHEPGTIILRQGELGTALHAIIDGEALVYLEGRRAEPLARLGAGEVFGEMALVLDQPRTATVEAATTLELFTMDRELFRAVLAKHPPLAGIFSRMIKRRLVENVMATAPLFQQLDPDLRKEVMLKFQIREVPPATKLVEQGTPSDGLYVLLTGSVEVLRDAHVAAVLTPGQTFGVASLIDADHKSPTAFRAPTTSIVLRLPRGAFQEVISAYPPVLEHLAEVAERQQAWGDAESVPVV
jgi:CRP-like cAMP-binding protein